MTDKLSARILLLDDEPFVLKLLARMLANLGFTAVATCENGAAALAQLDHADGPPELILMDINMPEMDGVEFLRKLVERGYAGSIIVVSGEDQRVIRATEALVQAYNIPLLGQLQKPVSPAGLAALLEAWSPGTGNLSAPEQHRHHGADALRHAIANGELVNYYQPIVAVLTGRVVGVEALVRWRHPAEGLLLPEKFLGEAMQHELIGDLCMEVFTAAVAQAQTWHNEGRLLQISINLSAHDLTSLDFADIVANLTGEAGISPHGIMLEVPESLLLRSSPALLETLTRLRLKRFRLSIDDFGSAPSSLAQLRNIPFNEVKLNANLIHDARTSDPGGERYRTCLQQARQLEVQVVGKGVENLEDWDLLHRSGGELAQGYFIGKPMPAADLPGWMSHWHKRVNSGFRNATHPSGG